MRKFLVTALSTLAFLSIAAVAFAEDGAAAAAAAAAATSAKLDSYGLMMVCVAAAVSMSLSVMVAALSQGWGLKTACEGIARNPEASGKIMQPLIIGLAFIESLAIYSLVINLILLVANGYA